MNISVISTRIGYFYVEDDGVHILRIEHLNESSSTTLSELAIQLKDEINEYLSGLRTSFDIPYLIQGSLFQQEVLVTLSKVKYGETISYAELAKRANHPGSSRAVGTVCKKNPLPLVIPCHRIIKADGSYGKYALGNDLKQYLIELERHPH